MIFRGGSSVRAPARGGFLRRGGMSCWLQPGYVQSINGDTGLHRHDNSECEINVAIVKREVR